MKSGDAKGKDGAEIEESISEEGGQREFGASGSVARLCKRENEEWDREKPGESHVDDCRISVNLSCLDERRQEKMHTVRKKKEREQKERKGKYAAVVERQKLVHEARVIRNEKRERGEAKTQ